MLIIFLIGLLLIIPSQVISYGISPSELITLNEGSQSCMSLDKKGNPIIGIGYNLNNVNASKLCSSCGIPYEESRSGKYCLSQTQIDCLFQPSLDSAINCSAKSLSQYLGLCENAQAVAADVAYSLGCEGYNQFKGFISDLDNWWFPAAATYLNGTQWCGEEKSRCNRDQYYLKLC